MCYYEKKTKRIKKGVEMVSDILFDAIVDIENYLKEGWYKGKIKKEIIAVKTIMNSLRVRLDAPPEELKKKTNVGKISKS